MLDMYEIYAKLISVDQVEAIFRRHSRTRKKNLAAPLNTIALPRSLIIITGIAEVFIKNHLYTNLSNKFFWEW